jgi:hypothetical protein
MSKAVIVKLESAGDGVGPFNVQDNIGTLLGTNVTKQQLIAGVNYTNVNDVAQSIVLTSVGKCKTVKSIPIQYYTPAQINNIVFTPTNTTSLWRHLTDVINYNKFYGHVYPYVIEYPFYYEFRDEILQNIKDYTTAYEYLPIPDGVFNDNAVIQTNKYFNKAILYNGQQCTGLLNLVPKPKNNLAAYMAYPLYFNDSKSILVTKSDNFYQYNTFWSILKDITKPIFGTTCESLSIDKELNLSNLDYTTRSFNKDPLRAKGLKVRHILDNSSTVHLVSQFIIAPSQISYK